MKVMISTLLTLVATTAFATGTGHTGTPAKKAAPAATATTTNAGPGTGTTTTGEAAAPATGGEVKKAEAKVDCKDPKNKMHADCKKAAH